MKPDASKMSTSEFIARTADFCLTRHENGTIDTAEGVSILVAAFNESIASIIEAMVNDGVLTYNGKASSQ
jgi:hypothetical protein